MEAVSWALNLAPVPVDAGGKPNSACAFVLVGLANHAGPDGTAAFPSVGTLVRYTRLSERTVRTALDRLEEAGLVQPCAPEIIAARIRRADRRPQGWDLDLARVRADLDDDDITALERQYPGLRDRIQAARGAAEAVPAGTRQAQNRALDPVDKPRNGVQQLHPAAETPVDNRSGGVQRLHPASDTGCNQRTNGVQPTQPRGAAIAPEPSIEPSIEPPAAPARTREPSRPAGGPAGGGAVREFFDALGPGWLLTAGQRSRLAAGSPSRSPADGTRESSPRSSVRTSRRAEPLRRARVPALTVRATGTPRPGRAANALVRTLRPAYPACSRRVRLPRQLAVPRLRRYHKPALGQRKDVPPWQFRHDAGSVGATRCSPTSART